MTDVPAQPQHAAPATLWIVSEEYQPHPGGVAGDPIGPARTRSSSGGPLGWLIATVIVLILAVAGGLFTAWIVANMRAVPGPVGGVSPTPTLSGTAAPTTAAPSPTALETPGPRRTPTPEPTVEVTPEPHVHVVARGESLIYIATLYGVAVEDILELNDIANANRIQVDQVILIPGYGIPPTPRPRR